MRIAPADARRAGGETDAVAAVAIACGRCNSVVIAAGEIDAAVVAVTCSRRDCVVAAAAEIDAVVAVAIASSRGYRVVIAAAVEIDAVAISQKSDSAKIEIDVALGR